jgi:hypothetical protein
MRRTDLTNGRAEPPLRPDFETTSAAMAGITTLAGKNGWSGRVCLKTISRRRGELHEPTFSKAFNESGARVTSPSDIIETVPAALPCHS